MTGYSLGVMTLTTPTHKRAFKKAYNTAETRSCTQRALASPNDIHYSEKLRNRRKCRIECGIVARILQKTCIHGRLTTHIKLKRYRSSFQCCW